jgi:hypothetical protein
MDTKRWLSDPNLLSVGHVFGLAAEHYRTGVRASQLPTRIQPSAVDGSSRLSRKVVSCYSKFTDYCLRMY